MKKLQYITDAEGEVTHVILPIDLWDQLKKQIQGYQKKAIDFKDPIKIEKGDKAQAITIKKEDFEQLVESNDLGLDCYVNYKTGEVGIFVPEEYMEIEEDIKNFEAFQSQLSDCTLIPRMSSNESFSVMEDFAQDILTGDFQKEVLQVLNQPEPFRKFRDLVFDSEFANKWNVYHKQRLGNWILEQIPVKVKIVAE